MAASLATSLNAVNVVVDMADLQVCTDPAATLVTYSLGSCIALCLYDPVVRAGGMIHYMLPLAKTSPEKAKTKPAMFADTGIPLLFEKMFELGCERSNLIVKAAGGGTLNDDMGVFNIGPRNFTVLRKLMWKNGIMMAGEDVGGAISRTVRLSVADGRTVVSSHGREVVL